jgi:hypothetical protein
MSSTSTPTRQARVRAPIVQKQRQLATDIPNRSLSAAKKQETYNAEIQVKAHLGPQVGKRVISPALPASPLSVPANTAPTQRRTRQPIGRKLDDISDRAAKYQDRAKQQREEEEKKAAKKAVKTEKKKAAKEKKAEGKARRGSKREMVSEEQVRTKRAKLERKSSQ